MKSNQNNIFKCPLQHRHLWETSPGDSRRRTFGTPTFFGRDAVDGAWINHSRTTYGAIWPVPSPSHVPL